MKLNGLLMAAAVSLAGYAVADGAEVLDVKVSKPVAPIAPTMYGLFFEDINYGADGGLYAELVKNCSFEFPQALSGWQSFGNVDVLTEGAPFERNPHYVRLTAAGHGHKYSGLQNEGFFGVTAVKGNEYCFSVWARLADGSRQAKILAEIADPASGRNSQIAAKAEIKIESGEWRRYECRLKPSFNVDNGVVRIVLAKPDADAVVDLDHISLFPADTWRGRPGGLRKDLAQALYDLHPGVFRFPGGCIVEGTEIGDRYQWKNTVGPVENRPLNTNRWHYTFADRFYPDYFQTGGLGFYEYFLLSEDIGAEPLPVLNVGLACQYQNNSISAHVPVDSLQPYIDDALDLIEFANGDTTTTWGALRAGMGHPAPFGLKYIAIGNEQWGPEYVERLAPFVKAIRSRYPDIRIVGSSGPSPDGDKFDYLWPEMKRLGADLVDEHYYKPEDWFENAATRYDTYDRRGPEVFAGEYACHGKGKKFNHYNTALREAAMMTGLERNADIVTMATYAPLFAHVKGWQWRPDMIWFDNKTISKTSSYNVQQMYSLNKGTDLLTLTMEGRPVAGLEGQNGLYASAVLDSGTDEYIVKIVNISPEAHTLDVRFDGVKRGESITGLEIITLTPEGKTDALEGTNLQCHSSVSTERLDAAALDGRIIRDGKRAVMFKDYTIPAETFTVLRFKTGK